MDSNAPRGSMYRRKKENQGNGEIEDESSSGSDIREQPNQMKKIRDKFMNSLENSNELGTIKESAEFDSFD